MHLRWFGACGPGRKPPQPNSGLEPWPKANSHRPVYTGWQKQYQSRQGHYKCRGRIRSGGRRGFQPPHKAGRAIVGFSPGGMRFGLFPFVSSFPRAPLCPCPSPQQLPLARFRSRSKIGATSTVKGELREKVAVEQDPCLGWLVAPGCGRNPRSLYSVAPWRTSPSEAAFRPGFAQAWRIHVTILHPRLGRRLPGRIELGWNSSPANRCGTGLEDRG